MRSLVLTLDPEMGGGVQTMEKAMWAAHVRLGLESSVGYARAGRMSRFNFWPKIATVDGRAAASFGYFPTIEYLNYLLPAFAMRRRLQDYGVVQVVTGSHAASMIPILARHPFVSWVATPFRDEIESRFAGQAPSASVRINYRLRAANDFLERWSYRFPGRVFALSTYTARRLAEVTGMPERRFEVLRFPIDFNRFQAEGPRWGGMPGRYIVSSGRVDDDRKNVPSLLRCFANVRRNHPDVSLVLVGRVAPGSRVVQYAAELGLASRVRFTGLLPSDELVAVYRSADAYVMTSRQEGLGLVVLEAQATGRPALVMRCGGSDELIEHGKTGWLVDQGDEATFASLLDEILSNRPLRADVGHAARRQAERTSSVEAFDRTLRGAYEDVFAEFRASSRTSAAGERGAEKAASQARGA